MRDLLGGRGEEVGRLDLADGARELVPLALVVAEVLRLAVACCHGRLDVVDVQV